MAKNPQQIAANWAAKMQGASANATAGAQAVSTSPGQAAAAQRNAYQQGVQQNVDKWANNVAAVSTDQWRQAYIQKGVPRMASGAQAAQPKMANFMSQLIPYQQSIQLPARGPKGTNVGRMTAWHDAMLKFRANK